jgi:pimeloyl-ACP methyl ester carboxylesterase
MKKPSIGQWRSEQAHQRFIEMEDGFWRERWPDPPAALDLETFAGTTRMYRWEGAGPPIVFLHGMGGTGLTWSPYVELLRGRDVYAIDTIGDVGRSEQRVVIEDAAGLARWLGETLDGAGIEAAHLVGTSYGAYLALNLASRAPQRVAALTLIDSAGLAPFRLGKFMLWGMPMLLGSKAPARLRTRLARRYAMLEDPRLMQAALLAQWNHPFPLPAPVVLTDDELRGITVPTSVIVAGKSAPFDPAIAATRARLLPNAVVDVVPDAGHEISWTHIDHCLGMVKRATP